MAANTDKPPGTFTRGGHSVTIAEDGKILVRKDDWLSKYSWALYGDYDPLPTDRPQFQRVIRDRREQSLQIVRRVEPHTAVLAFRRARASLCSCRPLGPISAQGASGLVGREHGPLAPPQVNTAAKQERPASRHFVAMGGPLANTAA
jgi:hypothetical protein